MALTLSFLGKLVEIAGDSQRVIDSLKETTWHELLDKLEPELAEAVSGEKVRVAVNGDVLSDKTRLRALTGDEVAFLPPNRAQARSGNRRAADAKLVFKVERGLH